MGFLAKLDDAFVKKAMDKIPGLIRKLQSCINSENWEGLAELLSEQAVLILPTKRVIAGRTKIVNYWKDKKKLGLKELWLYPKTIQLEPCDRFVKLGKVCYARFDASAFISGEYQKNPGTADPPFHGEYCHREDCNWLLCRWYMG